MRKQIDKRTKATIKRRVLVTPDVAGSRAELRGRRLDDVDRAIIGRLQIDGRASVRSIARAIGASEVTVRRRIDRLLLSRILQIRPIVDPEVYGYEVVAELGLEIETGKVRSVSTQLAQLDEVFFLAITAGKFDVLAWVVLSNKHDLLVFLTEKLAAVEGIRRTETSTVLELVKRAPSWGIAR